jgi:hypothetical protein
LTLEKWLEELALAPLEGVTGGHEDRASAGYKPISKVIAAIMSDVPPESFASLPSDAASQLDHYVYGHPKR